MNSRPANSDLPEAVPEVVSELQLAEELLRQADSLLAGGLLGEALPCYERALLLRPELITEIPGRALLRLNRPEGALAAFERSLAVNPEDVDERVRQVAAVQHLVAAVEPGQGEEDHENTVHEIDVKTV